LISANQRAQNHQKNRNHNQRDLALAKKQQNKVRRLQTVKEVEAMFPGFKAFLDATEQEIPRPKASVNKRHTTAA